MTIAIGQHTMIAGFTQYLFLFIFCGLFSCGNTNNSKPEVNSVSDSTSITIGIIDTITSTVLGEKRALWISVPDSMPGPGWSCNKKGFPVLYLLDAPSNFHSVVGILRAMSRDEWNSMAPQMIVVGIPNTNRLRDLSPTRATAARGMNSESLKQTGGGENFSKFLETELFPYIERRFKTLPCRILMGHSMGGLFAMYELVNHPELFNAVISIDPAVYWDKEKIIEQTAYAIETDKLKGRSLFVAMAHNWQSEMDSAQLRHDTSEHSVPSRAVQRLIDVLKRNKSSLHWSYKFYDNENHASIPHPATYDGLRNIFSEYMIPGYNDLIRKEFDVKREIERNYQTLYQKVGFRFAPSEASLYLPIYTFLNNENNPDRALPLIEIMLKYYPDLYSNWAMGQYYEMKGDKKAAIRYVSEAIRYYPADFALQKLKDLKSSE